MIRLLSFVLASCLVLVGAAHADPAAAPPAGPPAAPAEPVLLQVEGAPYFLRLTDSMLQGMPRARHVAREKGKRVVYEGVLLSDVMRKAGTLVGKDQPTVEPINYVVVRAGLRRVLFSLAEIDPEIGRHAVLVVDRMNGKPLPPDQGPIQVIAPGDKGRMRWLKKVGVITHKTFM